MLVPAYNVKEDALVFYFFSFLLLLLLFNQKTPSRVNMQIELYPVV